jgi:zinc and cadmium transporter
MIQLIYSLLACLFVSLLSLAGLALIFTRINLTSRINLILVSFAVGTLLGDAFFHLLPYSYSVLDPRLSAALILLGLILFLFVEKILRWHHCHELGCPDDSSHLVSLNIFGDSVHNLIDGMLITASFLTDFRLGLATFFAVVAHEIPQEIGDFGILIHSKLPPFQALRVNFFTALTSFIGVFITYFLGLSVSNFSKLLLPITAGGFIYLAGTDLIPELHRHSTSLRESILQIVYVIFGITLMLLLTFLE